MKKRALLAGTVALVLLTTAATWFGGWAVITVTDLPESITVGNEVRLEYAVRQHGISILNGLSGSVFASSGGRTVNGSVTGANGRYLAKFTVPSPGSWAVTITSGFPGNKTTLDPITAVAAGAPAPSPAAPVERGRHLFVAKGCGTCHVNRDVSGSGAVDVGPELVRGKLASDYVATVLADPTKVVARPGRTEKMPNLGLKPAEITALAAYLTKSHSSP